LPSIVIKTVHSESSFIDSPEYLTINKNVAQTAFLDVNAAPSARRSASSWSWITRSRHQCNDGQATGRRRRICWTFFYFPL